MQKMVAILQKLDHVEPEHARLARENSKLNNSHVRLKGERNGAIDVAKGLKTKLEGAKDSLSQALAEMEATKTESKNARDHGYTEGIDAANENYKTQMPKIQDEIWTAAWATCLTKVGVAETSSL